MAPDTHSPPRTFLGVMVSSTFTDLEAHRAELIQIINGLALHALVMESDSAKPVGDVIDSSLQMVHDSAAYVGLISKKYGQTPPCLRRNPGERSITELEFDEALRLGRPILLFIMGDAHQVLEADVELDPVKRAKLSVFRERAKKEANSEVHRVYAVFESREQFAKQAARSIAELRRHLEESAPRGVPSFGARDTRGTIRAPDFCSEPPYVGSHAFVGRTAQLDALSDWARPADPHPILLFEAIGGTGKSMLTWEWTCHHSMNVRTDWAGRFWYSFYERGAEMADFCRRALAYVTGEPPEAFRKRKTTELSELLLRALKERPWLIVLDGLERVLVAYHRHDAAQLPDHEAGTGDAIAKRDPCAAIRPEDDDFLRLLAAASPSKLLVTSRLTPRVLLNAASQPIPGVLREPLPGLRPVDAEVLLRACQVRGDSAVIQEYLQTHCACHPLVTGVLAGLVQDYLPDRGNFDAWAADPEYGGKLNLAELDLVQKRNHILLAALAALPTKSRELLATLALVSESVDYETLAALNPHLPQEPEPVDVPDDPKKSWRWRTWSESEQQEAEREYAAQTQLRHDYEHAVAIWEKSTGVKAAPHELRKTVRDLERRGLLQYDVLAQRYDLHPVVRGVAAGGLDRAETEHYGQRLIDHFSQRPHEPYEQAETLYDVRDGVHLVRTFLKMGRYEQAAAVYRSDLSDALLFNLEAYTELLALLHPFFPRGWGALPQGMDGGVGAYLANDAGIVLSHTGQIEEGLAAYGASLLDSARTGVWAAVRTRLNNISYALDLRQLARMERCAILALEAAALADDDEALFMSRLGHCLTLIDQGRLSDAESIWRLLDGMGRDWSRAAYRPGDAEYCHALLCFQRGDLCAAQLDHAEQLARMGKVRFRLRHVLGLKGRWLFEQGEWLPAVETLHEAVRMAREVEQTDACSEVLLAHAKHRLGGLVEPRREAERLAQLKNPFHRGLAELWLALGDSAEAKRHALLAYEEAWADGEPYVLRHQLNRARAVLEQLGAEIPELPPYDPAKYEKFFWEDELVAAIAEARAEQAAEADPAVSR